jgi:hypothetical protein
MQETFPGLSYESKICILKSLSDFFAGIEMRLLPLSKILPEKLAVTQLVN